MRREDENCMKRILTAEVNRRRSRGRQKKRWGDTIQQDMTLLRLKKEDTGDRKKSRGRNHVVDPCQRWTGVSKAARENVQNGPKLNVTVIFLLYPRSQVTL